MMRNAKRVVAGMLAAGMSVAMVAALPARASAAGPGEFTEDFGSFAVGNTDTDGILAGLTGLAKYDSFDATAEILADAGTANGQALHVDAYDENAAPGSDQATYSSITLITQDPTPTNFRLDYRLQVTGPNGDGWPAILTYLDANNTPGDFNQTGPVFEYNVSDLYSGQYLTSAYQNYDNELSNPSTVGGWDTVTLTYFNGTYAMYVNGVEIGSRDWGPRNGDASHGYLQFRIGTMNVDFDYITVAAYDGSPIVPPVAGAFDEDFTNFAVGDIDLNALDGLREYDRGYGATAAIVDGQDTANGKALYVNGYVDGSVTPGTDDYNYKSLTLITKAAAPDNFKLEYRIKAADADGGWPALLNWFNATDVYGDWDPTGPAFAYYSGDYPNWFLQSTYNVTTNELRNNDPSFDFTAWHTVTVTYFQGTYTLYIDGVEMGARAYDLRTEDFIRFRIGTMNMYIDYIKLEPFQGTVLPPPTLTVTSDKVGNIFDSTQTPVFHYAYYNDAATAASADVSYTVTDHNGTVVQQGDLVGQPVPATSQLKGDLTLDQVTGTGLFTLAVTVVRNGTDTASESADFSRVLPVIPNRSGEPFGTGTHFGAGSGDLSINPALQALGGLSLIRDDCAWQQAESTKGTIVIPQAWYDFVDAAQAQGMDPLLIFAYGNTNYVDEDPGMANRGIPTTDAGRAAFVRFAMAVVDAFYPKGVRYFEIWNEPNNVSPPAPFNPNNATPAQYTELMKAVYTAVKAQYPDVTLLAGSMAPHNGVVELPWLEGMLQAGAAQYMDVLSLHPYTYSNGTSAEDADLVGWLNQAEDLVKQYNNGNTIPIWATEIGWPTENDANGVSEEVSASYLVRSFTQMLSLGYVQKMVWYDFQDDGTDPTLNEDNFGTIRNWNDANLPWGAKASYVAQNIMAHILYQSSYVTSRLAPNREYLYQFARADGNDVIVAWDTDGARTVRLHTGDGLFTVTDMYGNGTPVQAVDGYISVDISPTPIYVVGLMSGELSSGTLDSSALEQAINTASSLNEDDWTTSSWASAAVPSVLAQGIAVLNGLGTTVTDQAAIDDAAQAINDAIAALLPRGDPSALAAMIAVVDAMRLDPYTAMSVAALQAALADGTAVYAARADKTQTQIDAATAAVQTALTGLVLAGNPLTQFAPAGGTSLSAPIAKSWSMALLSILAVAVMVFAAGRRVVGTRQNQADILAHGLTSGASHGQRK